MADENYIPTHYRDLGEALDRHLSKISERWISAQRSTDSSIHTTDAFYFGHLNGVRETLQPLASESLKLPIDLGRIYSGVTRINEWLAVEPYKPTQEQRKAFETGIASGRQAAAILVQREAPELTQQLNPALQKETRSEAFIREQAQTLRPSSDPQDASRELRQQKQEVESEEKRVHFAAKWRDAITDNPKWRDNVQVDWLPANPTRTDIRIRTVFAEQANAVGLDPKSAWDVTHQAAAYVTIAQREGLTIRDRLNAGFEPWHQQRHEQVVAEFKADLRDRIAFDHSPKTNFTARELALDPARTERDVALAAQYVKQHGIAQPGLTTGFGAESNPREKIVALESSTGSHAAAKASTDHKADRAQSVSPGFAI